jgi:CheY-like chemotaxis protein
LNLESLTASVIRECGWLVRFGELALKHLLLIDDEPAHLLRARESAEALGFEDIRAQTTIRSARIYLEEALAGNGTLPDAIVLDLDFGLDSGLELLRFWHSTPHLSKIPLLVWSILEEQERICELFGVTGFVCKADGMRAFSDALSRLV